jgi:hypothetical protein
MPNNLEKAEQWRDFVLSRCRYPAVDRLRAQFDSSTLSGFCQCGCNSFALVHQTALPPPLAIEGSYGMVFEANFRLQNEKEKTVEILLFTDPNGRLSYVEIDCLGNNFPVPEITAIDEEPFYVQASERLIL